MTASVHCIADVFDPVQPSRFSPEEKAAILREAREARKKSGVENSTPALPKPEDAVAKWRREADEQREREERELECERREQQARQHERERQARQQQREQRRDASKAWRTFIENRFESERDFQAQVLGELVAGITADFESKIRKLEGENATLRAEMQGFATRLDVLAGHRSGESADITKALLLSQRESSDLRKRLGLVESELNKWRGR